MYICIYMCVCIYIYIYITERIILPRSADRKNMPIHSYIHTYMCTYIHVYRMNDMSPILAGAKTIFIHTYIHIDPG